MMNYKDIYNKSFIFESDSFAEYQDGYCTKKGQCNTTIVAKVIERTDTKLLFRNIGRIEILLLNNGEFI